jgi:hypothetical protein
LAQYPVSCAINAQKTGDTVKRFFSLKNFIELYKLDNRAGTALAQEGALLRRAQRQNDQGGA